MSQAPVDDLSGYRRQAGWLGREYRYYASVGSTNDVALAAAEAGAPEGLVVVADTQDAGRGRLNRRWLAPPGSSLLLSLLFRPPGPLDYHAGRITMVCGLGLQRAVQDVCGLPAALKWPNDLIHQPYGSPLQWRKLAGMLSEFWVDPSGDGVALIVGIGVNVNVPAQALPAIAPQAGSLSAILDASVSRVALLDALLRHIEKGYDGLRTGEDPYPTWRRALAWIGQRVEVTRGGTVVGGIAREVNAEGHLVLQTDAGDVSEFSAGDVSLRRA